MALIKALPDVGEGIDSILLIASSVLRFYFSRLAMSALIVSATRIAGSTIAFGVMSSISEEILSIFTSNLSSVSVILGRVTRRS